MVRYTFLQRLFLLRFLLRAGREAAWRTIRNRINRGTMRKTGPGGREKVFRRYAITLLRPIRKVTCIGKEYEGPGSQALSIMNAIVLARWSGLRYVHTPFANIKHADRPREEWCAAWESVFNLGHGEVACEARTSEVGDYFYFFLLYQFLGRQGLELRFQRHTRTTELSELFKATIPEFRWKYYLNKSPRTTAEVTVAVHIRRGDVSTELNSRMFTGTDVVLRTIREVKSVLDAQGVRHRIAVYSEGGTDDFAALAEAGLELDLYRVGVSEPARADDAPFLDIDAIRAMQDLVEADVLIMANSSFSYYAALISDGIKINGPLYTALEGWIPHDPDGSFDRAEFERQLVVMLQAKDQALRGGAGSGLPRTLP